MKGYNLNLIYYFFNQNSIILEEENYEIFNQIDSREKFFFQISGTGTNFNFNQILDFYNNETLTQNHNFNFHETDEVQNSEDIIENDKNERLQIDSINVQGYYYELIARFDSSGNYFLFYDKDYKLPSKFDIKYFLYKIPNILEDLKLGNEVIISSPVAMRPILFIENKIWLWLIMVLIIGLIGFFSVKMIKND
jgi:hypothetical protein